MIREIYIRPKSDPNYQDGIIDYSDTIESIVSQIKVILDTNNGDVFGNYFMGINLDYLVFGTKMNSKEVEDAIMKQVREYVYYPSNITVECEVDFGDSGQGYDYAVINIYINGEKTIGFLVDKNQNV